MVCFFMLLFAAAHAKDIQLRSPDSRILVTISTGTDLRWSVEYNGEKLLLPSRLALSFSNGMQPGIQPQVASTKTRAVNSVIEAIVPVKSRLIPDVFNEVRLNCKGNYAVVFRAYNDGVAYRFETAVRDSVLVNAETIEFNFAANNRVVWPIETDPDYQSHFESLYKDTAIASFTDKQHAALPFLTQTSSGVNMLISESDLYDYPNAFLYGTGGNAVTARFPKVILESTRRGDRGIRISKLADHIAKTSGTRSFPWRSIAITPDDKGLLETNLTYKLASPNVLTNTGWIKPGKVAWDWWNANNVYGVNFKAGINTDTYKYYVDFAAAYGLEYIILDEGWTRTTLDLMHANDQLDIKELIRYANTKKVGVILWVLWNGLNENMDAILDQYAAWGAKGIKVDFMARADQYMVNFYERSAVATAKRNLLIDFHGAYKPVGLNRKYPNVINYEGVRGLENDKWSTDITPTHDVTLPFTRMAAGPMDYTPGAMRNAAAGNYHPVFTEPMSQGTRAHQVAMYVLYDAPLQMLSDNPSTYLRDTACTAFMAQIPTVWDTTIALDGKVGQYAVVAKKRGTSWYIGAMTNWSARNLPVSLSFLGNKKYSMQLLKDGINADRVGSDYSLDRQEVTGSQTINLSLSKGGGWCAVLKELQ
ncbi:MAG: glycoside hydrolase family 97 protein [Williamsia sp.]|nr:glycoside hydrolase family 97 protein [Williamsia sp.]